MKQEDHFVIRVTSLPSEQARPSLPEDVREGLRVEFKPSLFRAPKRAQYRQVEKIAQVIAGFMNAEGGSLYLGVEDDGTICGIERDLSALRRNAKETVVNGPHYSDGDLDYSKGNFDKYQLKISHLVKSYLGANAAEFISNVEIKSVSGLQYVRIDIRTSENNLVYYNDLQTSYDRLFRRCPAENMELFGQDRDLFVVGKKKKWYDQMFELQSNSIDAKDKIIEAKQREIDRLAALLDPLSLKSDVAIGGAEVKTSVEPVTINESGNKDGGAEKVASEVTWFVNQNGDRVHPDEIMEPERRKALAIAYREGRLRVPEDVLYSYLSRMVKVPVGRSDALRFLRYCWQNMT